MSILESGGHWGAPNPIRAMCYVPRTTFDFEGVGARTRCGGEREPSATMPGPRSIGRLGGWAGGFGWLIDVLLP